MDTITENIFISKYSFNQYKNHKIVNYWHIQLECCYRMNERTFHHHFIITSTNKMKTIKIIFIFSFKRRYNSLCYVPRRMKISKFVKHNTKSYIKFLVYQTISSRVYSHIQQVVYIGSNSILIITAETSWWNIILFQKYPQCSLFLCFTIILN